MITSRGTVASRMLRWDVGTLAWTAWDGSLTTGALTIGKVDQGAAGASPWLVDVSKLSLLKASGSASGSGNNTLITPGSGKKIRLAYVSYNPSATVEAAFRFAAAGALFLRNNVGAGSVIAKDFGDLRYLEGAVDEALVLNLSSAVTTVWNVFYLEI